MHPTRNPELSYVLYAQRNLLSEVYTSA